MPASDAVKKITLCILDILKKYSDEDHPLTSTGIIEKLRQSGIEIERKTVYRNLTVLEECGYSICRTGKGVFLEEREFELPEVRLLMDAVQSAYFITGKKTRQLLDKLGSLCSEHEFKALKKQIFIDYRPKCTNEEIYYSIDIINRAIIENMQITFQYLQYDANKNLIPRYDGKIYQVSPYALVWVNNMYYLLANMDKYDNLSHFRVDRIKSASSSQIKRRPVNEIEGMGRGFDPAEYIRGRFAMFSGPETRIQLKFNSELKDIIFERFGTDALVSSDANGMTVTANVLVDNAFYSWVFMLGDRVEIVSPDHIRQEMANKAKEIYNKYHI